MRQGDFREYINDNKSPGKQGRPRKASGKTCTYAISAEAFAEGADPKKGAYVVVDGTGFKPTTMDSAPAKTEYGFIGQIFDIATNGHYRIFVKQNKDLNA